MDPELAQMPWSDRPIVHFGSADGTRYEPTSDEPDMVRPKYLMPRPRVRIRVRRRK